MKKEKIAFSRKDIFTLAITLFSVLVLYFAFSQITNHRLTDTNPYNTYELQAESWLQKRVDIDNREWLELATYGGKYYVSFPPFPSVILLPFVALFGTGIDNYLSFFALILGVIFSYLLAKKTGLSPLGASLCTLMLYIGTNMRQITSDAWVWFFAQSLSFLFTVLSLYSAALGKKGLSMFFLACAVGCRPFQLVCLPIVLIILLGQSKEKTLPLKLKELIWGKIWAYIPALILAVFYCAYNYVRFGSIFEFGHNYLPEFLRNENGQFSIKYYFSNFPCLFRLPRIESGKLIVPSFNGMSIFLVIPFFTVYPVSLIVSFVRDRKIENGIFHLIGILLIMFHIFVLLCHSTMGGAHFGNRYIMDSTALLYFLSALSFKQTFSERDALSLTANIICFIFFAIGAFLNIFGTALFYGASFSFITFG